MEHHRTEVDGRPVDLTYLTRQDTGLGRMRSGTPMPGHAWSGLAVHHTVMVMADYDHDGMVDGDLEDAATYMRTLQTIRPDLGGEVPYSFVIFRGTNDRSVVVCEGRGAGTRGAHTAGLNSTVLGCALAGDHRTVPVTDGQVAGIRWVGATFAATATRPTIGHQEAPPYFTKSGTNLNATACPGGAGMNVVPRLQPPFANQPKDAPMSAAEVDQINRHTSAEANETRHALLRAAVATLKAVEKIVAADGQESREAVLRAALAEVVAIKAAIAEAE